MSVDPHPILAPAAGLEQYLGDPDDPGRIFSYRRCVALDLREEFPAEICRELDLFGVPQHYVPAADGGRLHRLDQAMGLLRAIARRDLTVAIGHCKTFLGAAPVWVNGTPQQRRALGTAVAAGAVVSQGVSEREHGSDLMATDLRADRVAGGGFRLTGEKWPINNATRGDLICVLARTDPQPGPRSLSVLLVDKRTLAPGSHRPLPAEPLLGIRGADISGISFLDARVEAGAVIGGEGRGMEALLRSFLLTRVLTSTLSLGAADHAVALALAQARTARGAGRRPLDHPTGRRRLAEACADLLTTEAVALVAGRAAHALTDELALLAPATKALLPTLTRQVLATVTDLLGLRAILAEPDTGRLQKLNRDHRVVGIFHGSTVVNLQSLITQFPFVARDRHRDRYNRPGLAAATDLAAPLPDFDPERLSLVARYGASPLHALPALVDTVRAAAGGGELPAAVAVEAEALAAATTAVLKQVTTLRPTARDHGPAVFDTAQDLAYCLAGAMAIGLWAANRQSAADWPSAPLWRDGCWLHAVLRRLRARLDPDDADDAGVFAALGTAIETQHASGQALSLLPYPQAPWR